MFKGSRISMAALVAGFLLAVPVAASAQTMQPAGTAEQRQAMQTLAWMDGEWVELGHFVMPGREPMHVIELRLRRRGDTGWPAADPVIP